MFEQMLADYSAARSQGCNVLYGQDALSTTTSHAGDDVAVLPVAEVSGLDLWIEENAETPPLSLNDWYVPVKGLKQFMDRQQRSAPVSEAVAGAVSEDDLNRIIIAALAATNSKRLWSLTHESGPYSINVVNHDTTRLFREFLRLIPADSEQVEGDARFEQLMRTLKNCAYDDGKQNRSANSKWTDAAEESFRAYVKQSRQAEAAQSALSQNKAGDV